MMFAYARHKPSFSEHCLALVKCTALHMEVAPQQVEPVLFKHCFQDFSTANVAEHGSTIYNIMLEAIDLMRIRWVRGNNTKTTD